MNLIVAVDENWGIGKNNDLLYHVPEDMKFFRSMTLGKNVVCGKKTLLSFPDGKPLPNRKHYVLTHGTLEENENLVAVSDSDHLEKLISDIPEDEVLLIGGGSVYRQLYKKCKLAYVTKIYASEKEADIFFPDLDEDPDFELISPVEIQESKNGIRFAFLVYQNKNI
jgi:dihydrofolate reductase